MSSFVSVGKVLDKSYSAKICRPLLDSLQFVPLCDSEIYVVSHRYPICVAQIGSRASVCAVVEGSHLDRPLIDSFGQWASGYKPIALRCAPFRLRAQPTGNPLEDLEIWEAALLVAAADAGLQGAIPIRNEEGKLSPELGTVYAGLRHVSREQIKLEAALDQLFLAKQLVPLGKDQPTTLTPVLSTLSDLLFDAQTNRALEAMARRTFAGVELAVAMIFSQMHLAPDLRPARVERLSLKHLQDDANALAVMATSLENLGAWLDEGDLFSLDHLVGFDQLPAAVVT